jgi:putative oxidoreductase
MKIVSMIARILLGLAFLVFGMNHYLNLLPMGPVPAGAAGQFMGVLISTKYINVVALFEVVPAIFFLFNRFVPLGLALVAPVLFNILLFLALMEPSNLPVPLVLTVLWFLVFYPLRSAFAGLMQRTT